MKVAILGAGGFIGRHLRKKLDKYNCEYIVVPKEVYFSCSGRENRAQDFLADCIHGATVIVNATGKVDPKAGKVNLETLNYQFPKDLLQFCKSKSITLINFGSALESKMTERKSNLYLESKGLFFDFLNQNIFIQRYILHIQLHTVYGMGGLHPHMFLSQLITSVVENKPFILRNPNAVREFHDIEGVVTKVYELISKRVTGIYTLTHEKRVTLGELSVFLLMRAGRLDLLELGQEVTGKEAVKFEQDLKGSWLNSEEGASHLDSIWSFVNESIRTSKN